MKPLSKTKIFSIRQYVRPSFLALSLMVLASHTQAQDKTNDANISTITDIESDADTYAESDQPVEVTTESDQNVLIEDTPEESLQENKSVETSNKQKTPKSENLDAMVFSASDNGVKRSSSAPRAIVTASDIQQKQVTNMTDLLRGEIPGFFVINSGVNDWTTQVFSRGTTFHNFHYSDLNNDYAKIFIDGIELARPTLLSMIDPTTIESIETIRGPQAGTIYGVDGSSGIMKITTKKGKATGGKPEIIASISGGFMESRYKPNGETPFIQNHSLQISGGNKELNYRLGGNYQSLGEWAPNYNSETWGLSGGINAQRGDFTVNLSAMHFDRELALSSYGMPDLEPGQGVDYPMIQTLVAATFGYQATPKWHHSLTIGQDKNTFSYEGVSRSWKNTLQRSDYTRRTLRYITTYDTDLNPDFSLNLTGGADAIYYNANAVEAYGFEYVNGKPNFNNAIDSHSSQDSWKNYGYYGMAEFGYRDKLFLTLAGRFEDQLRWVVPSEQQHFQPRLGLSYVLDQGPAEIKFRGQWGRSVRAPIMDVRQASGYQNNPHLGPDVKEGWDAGVDFTWEGINKLSVTYFNEEGRNLLMPVTLQTNPTIREYQNIGIISNKGWEIEGNAELGLVSIRGNVILPDNRWVKGSSPTDTRVGTRISSTPKYSGGTTVSVRVGEGSVSLNGYVLKMHDRDGVKRLNLRAEQPINDKLTVFGRVDNLLNDQDSERYDFSIAPGRATVLGVRMTF